MIRTDLARPMVLVGALLFAMVSVRSTAAEAGTPSPAAAGDRVRLLVYDERPITGRLVSFDTRSLEVAGEPDSTHHVLSRDAIAAIDVERTKSRAGLGAALGFVAGGVAGIVVSSSASSDDGSQTQPATAFVTGAVVGTVIGALLGKGSSTTRWREASFP